MDILLIAVLLVLAGFGLHGYLRGMVRLLFSLVAVFLTIGLATALAPYTTQALRTGTPVYDTVKDKCTEYLQAAVEDKLRQEENISIPGMQLPEEIQKLLTAEQAGSLADQAGFYEQISAFVAEQVLQRLGWVLSFIVVLIVLSMLIHFLDVVAKLPVLRSLNRIGGLVIGLFEGLLVVWILFLVVTLCQGMEFGREMMASVDRNIFLKFLYENNVIEKLILM